MLNPITKKITFKLWQAIPFRIRPYLVIFPLRMLLSRAGRKKPVPSSPVYVVGFFRLPTGLGNSARLFFKQLRETGVEVYAIDVTSLARHQSSPDLEEQEFLSHELFSRHQQHGTVVIHVNPPAYMLALWMIKGLLPNKSLIGYWAWELEVLPPYWRLCATHADEILVPSSFVAQAVRRVISLPVRVHPHAVPSPRNLPHAGKSPGNTFTVLLIFDIHSNFYRKNPLAAVQAFKSAFRGAMDAVFRIKVSNAKRGLREWQLLQKEVEGVSNIEILTKDLSNQEVETLYMEADVYLSLHRSEGYGLTIHEAMLHGLDVVATGWSGNMDFMEGPLCHCVPYTLVPVSDPQGSYEMPGARWAEPDIEAAAGMLQHVKEQWHSKCNACRHGRSVH